MLELGTMKEWSGWYTPTIFGEEQIAPLTLSVYETGHITRSGVKKPTNMIDKFDASTTEPKKNMLNTLRGAI